MTPPSRRAKAASLHVPCTIVALLLIVVNQVVLAAWPLLRTEASSYTPGAVILQPALTADEHLGCREEGSALAAPEASSSWRDLENPLGRLAPESLRVLPSGEEGKRIASIRRWMTFGMSSIKRPKASYLGITLSRMFNVLDLELAETAIIVHLADFDEEWVMSTAQWLQGTFLTEMSQGRLQVIHAPRKLYNLKQAALRALHLSGFRDMSINGKYIRKDQEVGGHVTYWSENGNWVLFWCTIQTAAVAHRRWLVGKTEDWSSIQSGACVAFARAPEDMEVLDPIITGWEEFSRTQNRWQLALKAGISNLDLSAGELLKFGDSPKRQWWRTKQNLDYTFLMWYAANLSDYYMQLEDDIQPVPHFSLTVRSYIQRSLVGKHWVMASFSSLGFIGKLFNNSHLPKLAEFLLTFSTEAPCDWLVWVWIDAMSPWPVASDIPKDVEKEKGKREAAEKQGPEAVKKLGFMRDDLQPYYLNSSWPQVFQTAPVAAEATKAWLDKNGALDSRFPEARVESSMLAYKAFKAELVYPPGDPLGFWTSDTCGKEPDKCKDGKKFIRLIFDEALEGEATVILRQSRTQHENDFIKQGSLRSSKSKTCGEPQVLKSLSRPEERWSGELQHVLCLEITLDQPQNDWIAIREVVVRMDRESEPKAGIPEKHAEHQAHSASYALQHALAAAILGLGAGSVAWLVVQRGKYYDVMRSVGCFAPWTLMFLSLLDIGLAFMKPSPSGETPHAKQVKQVGASQKPCVSQLRRSREVLPIDWRRIRPGISFLDATSLRHAGPGRDPREHSFAKTHMSVGVIAQADTDVAFLAQSLLRLAQPDVTVAFLLSRSREVAAERRQAFLDELVSRLHDASVHLLDPAQELYPPAPTKRENVDLSLLTAFLEPLADAFMVVEPDCSPVTDFSSTIKRYTDVLDSSDIPWIVVEFSPHGFTRKLIRSRLLPRFREMLVMFPDVPAESLFWDFIDVVGNETAPKSIYLGTDAGKRDRPDVKLQHNKHQALIEHLGDVSSLEGKVQRAQENFFKTNELVDSLFDNPSGQMRSNIPQIRLDFLQSLYDGSKTVGQVTCGGHTAESCSLCPQGHGASWCNRDCGWADGTCKPLFKAEAVTSKQDLWFEIVFDDVQDVEIVSVRMGGSVKPPATKDKADETPDDEFSHALDDAELLLGQGEKEHMEDTGCRRYFKVGNVAGREVFWKSNSSRYVKAVKCIKISIPRAQEHPLILRTFEVRSAKAGYNNIASLAAAGFNIPSSLEARWSLRLPQSTEIASQAVWQEQHLEWVLLMSVALVSGAFAGVLGCLLPARRRRK